MASVDECRSALMQLSGAIGGMDAAKRDKNVLDRTVSCTVPDLDAVFTGRLDAAGFHDVTTDPAPPAQIRLTIGSDDLVAIAAGRLSFATAWRHGQVKVKASFGDLLRLRTLF